MTTTTLLLAKKRLVSAMTWSPSERRLMVTSPFGLAGGWSWALAGMRDAHQSSTRIRARSFVIERGQLSKRPWHCQAGFAPGRRKTVRAAAHRAALRPSPRPHLGAFLDY